MSGSTDPGAPGNGSIMCLVLVAIGWVSEPLMAVEMAAQSSRTTHGRQEDVDGCRLLAAYLVGALSGVTKEKLLAPDGWIVEALPEALSPKIAAIAAGSESFEEGALMAVNLGDDADTTGAVFGQIGGAFYGVEGIPQGWFEKMAMRERIEELATQLIQTKGASSPS